MLFWSSSFLCTALHSIAMTEANSLVVRSPSCSSPPLLGPSRTCLGVTEGTPPHGGGIPCRAVLQRQVERVRNKFLGGSMVAVYPLCILVDEGICVTISDIEERHIVDVYPFIIKCLFLSLWRYMAALASLVPGHMFGHWMSLVWHSSNYDNIGCELHQFQSLSAGQQLLLVFIDVGDHA